MPETRSSAAAARKLAPPSFDTIRGPFLTESDLAICLKCAFGFFTKQLGLAARTAFIELKKHIPEPQDFSGAATARPHFRHAESASTCPYCNAPKRWIGHLKMTAIEAHPSVERERKRLWTALKKDTDRYALSRREKTPMEAFAEWLEREKRRHDLESGGWLLPVAKEYLARVAPAGSAGEIDSAGLQGIRVSGNRERPWSRKQSILFVDAVTYGDLMLIHYLISRSEHHGGLTLEGRMTLGELARRLRETGYVRERSIAAREHYQFFAEAVDALVATWPSSVYYAVDRSDYLKQLKTECVINDEN